MAKRLKLKKRVKIFLAIIGALLIVVGIGVHQYKVYKYHQTAEYKLLQKGYTNDDIKSLNSKLNSDELNSLTGKDKDDTLLKLVKEKYFIFKNLDRYKNFMQKNSRASITNTITYVNVNRDKKYYEDVIDTDTSKDTLMLVNKYYKLDEKYVPNDLVSISSNYAWGTIGSQQTRKVTYDAFQEMWEAANNEQQIYLMVNSSYRDYASQKEVYDNYAKQKNEKYADSIAARPGHSEHSTGLSLDIFTKTSSNKNTFKDNPAYTWLKDNSYKYGFILRYPENKEDITGYSFESWHYRYVGKDVAKYIYDNNITFDEYYAYFIEK